MEEQEKKDETVYYTCECSGCWACTGFVDNCTCDVDWDKVYGHDS